LGNLDKILAVVRPVFTSKKIERVDAQTDLLNQQIAELQGAAAANAEQIRALAAQLKDVISALEQAAESAARERAVARRMSAFALTMGMAALLTALVAVVRTY
jgi:uncharacterized coiled-coil protein SlyX